MRLHDEEYSRHELLRRVGHLHQVGGVALVTLEEGHSRSVRMLEFRTGSGFRFAASLPEARAA